MFFRQHQYRKRSTKTIVEKKCYRMQKVRQSYEQLSRIYLEFAARRCLISNVATVYILSSVYIFFSSARPRSPGTRRRPPFGLFSPHSFLISAYARHATRPVLLSKVSVLLRPHIIFRAAAVAAASLAAATCFVPGYDDSPLFFFSAEGEGMAQYLAHDLCNTRWLMFVYNLWSEGPELPLPSPEVIDCSR